MKHRHVAKTGNDQGLITDEDTGENIAVVYKKENAALIAAAPGLLQAAKTLLPLWDREDVADTWSAEFRALETAIREAEANQ